MGRILNPVFSERNFIEQFQKCWLKKHGNVEIEGSKIIQEPFNAAFLKDIFQDKELLNQVVSEIQTLKLTHKNNDLYKFKCTEDLNGVQKPAIKKLCQYIRGPLKEFVQSVVGFQLNDKVAISSSKYEYTDALLCHDDELEGRRIAFILYLVPPWKKAFGGSLDLFSVDELNRPHAIAQRFYPEFNSFAFFEVSPVSFHQVAEVLGEGVERITLNGWFHGDPIPYPSRPVSKALPFQLPGEVEEKVVYSWINPLYLEPSTQMEIRKDFKSKSEIQLPEFLQKKKFDQLTKALHGSDLVWSYVGPPNEKHFEVTDKNKICDGPVVEFLQLMKSEAIFLILSQLTGLDLHEMAPESESESEEDDESENSGASSGSENELSDSADRNDVQNVNEVNSSKRKMSNSDVDRVTKSKKKLKKKSKSSEHARKDTDGDVETAVDGNVEAAVGGLLSGWQCIESPSSDDSICSGNPKAEMRSEIRRWRWGSYSLMKDDDLKRNRDFVLDASLFCFGSRGSETPWRDDWGGQTVYVAKEEEEEILSVLPTPNSLALVYRDKETFRFTKHLNAKSRELLPVNSGINEFFCEFREVKKKS